MVCKYSRICAPSKRTTYSGIRSDLLESVMRIDFGRIDGTFSLNLDRTSSDAVHSPRIRDFAVQIQSEQIHGVGVGQVLVFIVENDVYGLCKRLFQHDVRAVTFAGFAKEP